MDIIEVFLESHAALRERLEALAAPFTAAHGVGWDDCMALDRDSLLREICEFCAAYGGHEALEDEFLSKVSARITLDAPTREAFAERRRSLRDIMKLFSAVAFSCDGEHVHRVRELLFRVREELGAHLAYEEEILFPMLRDALPAELLIELGRARGGPRTRHMRR